MEDQPKPSRPIWVWLITIYYLFSVGFTLLSAWLVLGGVVPLTEVQRALLDSLTPFDWALSIAVALLTLAGTVLLFMLRRRAVALFTLALTINLLSTAILTVKGNWAKAAGGPGLVGGTIGLLIYLVVALYARHLARKGVLR